MDHLTYLATEIAEDHSNGYMTRREALRRLALLGFSAMSASTLLAACGGSGDDDDAATVNTTAAAGQQPATTTGGATGPTTTQAASGTRVPTSEITYPGRGITIRGAFAAAAGSPRGAVLVMHENQGLNDSIRSVASRLAGDGYSALAVDLLSAQGGTAALADAGTLGAALNDNASNRAVDDMRSSLEELQRRAPGAKLAAVGFCFGGGMVWTLLKAGDPPPLAAAVPFYGAIATPEFTNTKAAVLGVYAETDTRITQGRGEYAAALQRAGLPNEIKVYPGVGHAFFNETRPSYNATQATAAYQDMLNWFSRYLR